MATGFSISIASRPSPVPRMMAASGRAEKRPRMTRAEASAASKM
jgi:hypothetical protein